MGSISSRLDEVGDLDRARRDDGHFLEVLVVHHDVAAGRDLVALDDLVVRDLDVLLGAEALLLDPRHVLLVQHVEVHVLLFRGRVELDRDRHHAEADGALPEWSWHFGTSLGVRAQGRGLPILRQLGSLVYQRLP